MAIVKLDKHVAELIAAGEVVERPASVAKELAENAIDAGARSVEVDIERGGVALLRVADDGCGIEAEDLPLAFVRHATSKVKTEQDLEAIATLGFRGEALASISSVARVEVLTKAEADEFASLCRVAGGGPPQCEVAARARGTTVLVRDLFYNTPARMKFLKKDASEGTFVSETVARLALSHPEVAFRFRREGKPVFATPGDGDLTGAAWAVLGKEFARGLLPVAGEAGALRVSGLVTPPAGGRASRGMQYFFINGRFVKNRTMMAALEQAYRGLAMQGRFPGGLVFLQMPPEMVDVNVHPAKTEVRFTREKEVFDAVYRAVRAALMDSMGSHGGLSFGLAGADGAREAAGGTVGVGGAYKAGGAAGAGIAGGLHEAGGVEGAGGAVRAAGEAVNGRHGATATQMPGTRAGAVYTPAAAASAAGLAHVAQPGGTVRQVEAYNDLVEESAALSGSLQSDAAFIPYQRANPVPPAGSAALAYRGSLDVPFEDGRVDVAVVTSQIPAAGGGPAEAAEPLESAERDEQAEPAGAYTPEQTALEPEGEQALRLIGEVFKTYIVAEADGKLCLIDKHAAHERILYERIAAEVQGRQVAVQQLLAPVPLALAAEERAALLENDTVLAEAGIEVEDFGGGSVLVRGVPADVAPDSVEALVEEVASRLAVNSRDSRDEKAQWVLHSIACRAAVKAGQRTPPAQLLALAESIMAGRVPPFCPHGRPVVLEMSKTELERQFGRLG